MKISRTSVPNRIPMFLGLPDPHPDPLVKGTDPRIRIRTKMWRIPNKRELYQKCQFISVARKKEDSLPMIVDLRWPTCISLAMLGEEKSTTIRFRGPTCGARTPWHNKWRIGYSGFHNLMGFTSKKMQNNIVYNICKKKFFNWLSHFLQIYILQDPKNTHICTQWPQKFFIYFFAHEYQKYAEFYADSKPV